MDGVADRRRDACALCRHGETTALTRLDVTAAVRAAGDGLATATANVATYTGYEVSNVFDGVAVTTSGNNDADKEVRAGMFSAFAVATNAYEKGGIEIVYEISDSFESGKDVVIDGYSILTGSNVAWAFNRLPGTWKFQAYDTATSAWVTLDEHAAYADWKTKAAGLAYDGTACVGNVFRFLNSRAFRKFRLLVTAPYWRTTGIWTDEQAAASNVGSFSLTEMQLFGYVAEGIDGMVNTGLLDLTATVRASGDGFRTVSANLTPYSDAMKPEMLFDGDGTTRFFSNYTYVKTAYEAGGAFVEYEIADAFAPKADIVVTGYSIFCATNYSHVLRRMPCDWKFQGYDEAAQEWKTIDAYHDFTCWEMVECDGAKGLGFRFDFANTVSFRKYRLLITRPFCVRNGDDPSLYNYGAIQLSDVRIFGYLGDGIAGTVGMTPVGHALKLTQWTNEKISDNSYSSAPPLVPIVSTSGCTTLAGSVTNLFDGKTCDDRFLCVPSATPFDICYEIPETMFLNGKDVVLTNYVMEVCSFREKAGGEDMFWANYAARVPLSVRFEAWADGRWVALDRRNEVAWATESVQTAARTYLTYRAVCEIATAKQFSATRYRLRVVALSGAADLQLSELTFNGVWGAGIANPPPARKGLAVIVR